MEYDSHLLFGAILALLLVGQTRHGWKFCWWIGKDYFHLDEARRNYLRLEQTETIY
jgi:hypothetical protein